MKAIQVKCLPATDTKPRRWKAIAEGVPHIIVGSYDATARDAALLLCEKYNWGRDLIEGGLPNGDLVFVFAHPDPRIAAALDAIPGGESEDPDGDLARVYDILAGSREEAAP